MIILLKNCYLLHFCNNHKILIMSSAGGEELILVKTRTIEKNNDKEQKYPKEKAHYF